MASGITLVPVTEEQFAEARTAWRRFGKGRHPAALNFGDCIAYSLAKTSGEPLLFKGSDFSRTDIESAFFRSLDILSGKSPRAVIEAKMLNALATAG